MKKRLFALILAMGLLLSGCVSQVPQAPAQGTLQVHFLDVGQADCALLECDGEYLLIDGGNREDGQLVVSYLEQQGVEELKAVVCTHAHEDHVGGLPSVLAVYPTAAVYAPTKVYASRVFDDFLYYVDQQGLELTIPAPGDTLTLGGAQITVLGPVKTYAETNDTSIVLRVVYGDTAFLFTGDMEQAAESDMLDHWQGRMDLNCDVLKVGHHGSDTSTGYRLLREVAPDYGVISVEKGNSYGHPHREPLERLAQAEVVLLRTDQLDHILAVSDGKEVTFTWQDQSAQPEAETAGPTIFIGNKNTKKFHSPHCANLPSEKNQVEFATYQAAENAGYEPCGNCLD